MAHPEYWLYAFSLFGLFAVPAGLRRAAWIFLALFALLNAFLLFAPGALHPARNLWVFLALSQLPWLLYVLDLLAGGRLSPHAARVSLRSLLGWSLFCLMGARLAPVALQGDLPLEFALRAAMGAILIALGAAVLWAIYRPRSLLWRALLVFWNTGALAASLSLSLTLLRAHPALPFFRNANPELHRYYTAWPNAWEPFFWIPLSIMIHATIFFRIYREAAGVPDGTAAASAGPAF